MEKGGCVRVIEGEEVRRDDRVKIEFLDADKINRMGQEKVKYFIDLLAGSKTSSIPLKNP